MLTYALRRLVYVPLSLLVVLGAAFVILRLTGNPIDIFLDPTHTQEQADALAARLHLDAPIPVQFLIYLRDFIQGDFGESLQFGGSAMQAVIGRLGATAELLSAALALSLSMGVLGGILCALQHDRTIDLVLSTLAIAVQSMPSFWLGILLIQVFAVDLGWLPTSGRGDLAHLVLPATTLAAFVLPSFLLITRTSILEAASEQFVVTARSKGMSGSRLMLAHVFPNALNPILSFLGMQVGRLMAGSIVTETIFSWPGVGRLLIGSIFQRDVPVVLAGVLVVSLCIIAANLVVDVLLSINDPRVRLD